MVQLQGMGADVVTTAARLKQDLASSGLAPPALGLNCVGGDAAAVVAKALRCGSHVPAALNVSSCMHACMLANRCAAVPPPRGACTAHAIACGCWCAAVHRLLPLPLA